MRVLSNDFYAYSGYYEDARKLIENQDVLEQYANMQPSEYNPWLIVRDMTVFSIAYKIISDDKNNENAYINFKVIDTIYPLMQIMLESYNEIHYKLRADELLMVEANLEEHKKTPYKEKIKEVPIGIAERYKQDPQAIIDFYLTPFLQVYSKFFSSPHQVPEATMLLMVPEIIKRMELYIEKTPAAIKEQKAKIKLKEEDDLDTHPKISGEIIGPCYDPAVALSILQSVAQKNQELKAKQEQAVKAELAQLADESSVEVISKASVSSTLSSDAQKNNFCEQTELSTRALKIELLEKLLFMNKEHMSTASKQKPVDSMRECHTESAGMKSIKRQGNNPADDDKAMKGETSASTKNVVDESKGIFKKILFSGYKKERKESRRGVVPDEVSKAAEIASARNKFGNKQ